MVTHPSPPTANLSSDLDDDDDLPAPGKVWEGPRESLSAMMAKHAPPPPAATEKPNIEPVPTGDLSAKWQALLSLLAEQGPALHGLLQHGRFSGIEDGRAVVVYSKQNETFVKMLERNNKKDIVRDAFSKVLDQNVGIVFKVDETEAAPPPPVAAPVAAAKPAPRPAEPAAPPPPPMIEANNTVRLTDEIRTTLYKSDPLVRALVDQLGGSVIKLEE